MQLKRFKINKAFLFFLGCIVFGTATSSFLFLSQFSSNISDVIERDAHPAFRLRFDDTLFRDYHFSNGTHPLELPDPQSLTVGMMEEIRELPYVRQVEFNQTAFSLFSEALLPVRQLGTPHLNNVNAFRLYGVDQEGFLFYKEGLIQIDEGRNFNYGEIEHTEPKLVALISRDFAELNELVVGSTFRLDNSVYDWGDERGHWGDNWLPENLVASEALEFEVIGVFNSFHPHVPSEFWWDEGLTVEEYDHIFNAIDFEYLLRETIIVPKNVISHIASFQHEHQLPEAPDSIVLRHYGIIDSVWDIVIVLNTFNELPLIKEAVATILPPYFQFFQDMDYFPVYLYLQELSSRTNNLLIITLFISIPLLTYLYQKEGGFLILAAVLGYGISLFSGFLIATIYIRGLDLFPLVFEIPTYFRGGGLEMHQIFLNRALSLRYLKEYSALAVDLPLVATFLSMVGTSSGVAFLVANISKLRKRVSAPPLKVPKATKGGA